MTSMTCVVFSVLFILILLLLYAVGLALVAVAKFLSNLQDKF